MLAIMYLYRICYGRCHKGYMADIMPVRVSGYRTTLHGFNYHTYHLKPNDIQSLAQSMSSNYTWKSTRKGTQHCTFGPASSTLRNVRLLHSSTNSSSVVIAAASLRKVVNSWVLFCRRTVNFKRKHKHPACTSYPASSQVSESEREAQLLHAVHLSLNTKPRMDPSYSICCFSALSRYTIEGMTSAESYWGLINSSFQSMMLKRALAWRRRQLQNINAAFIKLYLGLERTGNLIDGVTLADSYWDLIATFNEAIALKLPSRKRQLRHAKPASLTRTDWVSSVLGYKMRPRRRIINLETYSD